MRFVAAAGVVITHLVVETFDFFPDAANANTNNVGISFIGTFSERAPSDAMMSAAARIMRSMARTWGFALDRERVKGHRQIGSTGTSCPGNALYNRIDDLIARARSASGAAPTPATDTPPPATTCSLIRADASSLNIRPEPSTSRAPVGSLEGGQTATRLETVTGQNIDGVTRWYRIDHQGTVGFVSGAFASCAD